MAHDGDADRAVFVDNNGVFVEENQEFALFAQYICQNATGTIVTPVSTSLLIEMIAETAGCTVTYTPVGSIYVARKMRELIETGKYRDIWWRREWGAYLPGLPVLPRWRNDSCHSGFASCDIGQEFLIPFKCITATTNDKRKDQNTVWLTTN